jgi:hypothetical protein
VLILKLKTERKNHECNRGDVDTVKKRTVQTGKGMVKGAPSGLVISLLVHAAAFMLAGLLVVFSVVKKKEISFVPPPSIERPKMKLKKPKVKVKKAAKPASPTRIIAKINKAEMPDFQLPELGGAGNGFGGIGDLGGFDTMPNLGEMTLFGEGQSTGNDFVGRFYDLKRDRTGRPIPMYPETYADELTKFVNDGWHTSRLSKYYRSPKKLYTTSFMMGTILSTLGPKSFGEDTGGWCWMAHYKGQLVYHEDIKFRFWGMGNDVLLVRVGGKVVLNGSWHKDGSDADITIGESWHSTSVDDARFWYGRNKARVSEWIELKAGEPMDMELMIGEPAGGFFSAMLAVQVDGVDYELNRQGGPILPMFKTAEPSRSLQDVILRDLIRGEASVTNGPVFRDYVLSPRTNQVEETEVTAVSSEETAVKSGMRIWTTTDGKEIEAESITVLGGKVVLKTSRGKQVKIPLSKLSSDDRVYLELANPPEFNIDFVKLSESKISRYEQSPSEMKWGRDPPRVNDFIFGAKVKQRSAGLYSHAVMVEYFAIGKERVGDKYILLDRKSSTFIPTAENERAHGFRGEPIEFVEYDVDGDVRGERSDGNMVILTDESGRIIQHSASSPWLWEHIENLKKLPVGAYMDKTCTRTYPTSPKPSLW